MDKAICGSFYYNYLQAGTAAPHPPNPRLASMSKKSPSLTKSPNRLSGAQAFILYNSSFILSQGPASDYARFTLYRCTEFVTYTGSRVFAQGYAYSEVNRRALTL
jgi:hypothetical protein